MQIEGRKVHIAGSASAEAEPELLGYAHELVTRLVSDLVNEGSMLVVQVGGEPRTNDAKGAYAIIFDWTVLETVRDCLNQREVEAESGQKALITTIATERTDGQIPTDRRALWEELLKGKQINLLGSEMGWTSGALRRQDLWGQGDILIVLSGGEGVEHLAQLYSFAGKPVIPLDLDIGSSSNDGGGGAATLAKRMRAHPERFVSVDNPEAMGALLARMSTRQGKTDASEVSVAVVELLKAAIPPGAFYIRMLNKEADQYPAVEAFFRGVVDQFVKAMGFRTIEMGLSEVKTAIIHEDIFSQLHHAPLVIADLTGLRPDCLLELGYALGRNRKVILTAMKGGELTFDTKPIDCHFWSGSDDNNVRLMALQLHWERVRNRPAIFEPLGVI